MSRLQKDLNDAGIPAVTGSRFTMCPHTGKLSRVSTGPAKAAAPKRSDSKVDGAAKAPAPDPAIDKLNWVIRDHGRPRDGLTRTNSANAESQLNAAKPAQRRELAESLGLMTAGEFRKRLGYDIHSFNRIIGGDRAPKPKFTLSNGDKVFDRAKAEAFCKKLGR